MTHDASGLTFRQRQPLLPAPSRRRMEPLEYSPHNKTVGLDERGKIVPTLPFYLLGMRKDGSLVYLSHLHEDPSVLEADPKAVEARVKKGETPFVHVERCMHIITAVRSLKHIRENYAREQERNDILVDSLREVHLEAAKRNNLPDAALDSIIAKLKVFEEANLSHVRCIVKDKIMRERIHQTIDAFEKARSLPYDGGRAMQFSRALAIFGSAYARLEEWRTQQVKVAVRSELRKEHSLRAERDRWLMETLIHFATDFDTVLIQGDMTRTRLVALSEIDFAYRARKRALAGEALEEYRRHFLGVKGPHSKEIEGLYREIEIDVRAKTTRPNAKAKLRMLELIVEADYPPFVLEELQKDPEYLKDAGVIVPFVQAVAAFEAGDELRAANRFIQAAELLARRKDLFIERKDPAQTG